MIAANIAALSDERAGYWLNLDGWTVKEAFALLQGNDPDVYFNGARSPRRIRIGERMVIVSSEIEEHTTDPLFKLLERAGDAGRLKFPAVPGDVIAWAKSKNLSLPRQFIDGGIDSANQEHPASVVAGGKTPDTPQDRRAAAAIKARGIKRDILENWEGIASQYGPDADAAQVARFFSTRRDASQPKLKRKTYHNRLGELRAAGLIP